MYLKHNDYEILHEIREGNHEALQLMFEKYKNLIAKKIVHFNLMYDFDDMMQEGYMILYKSIVRYKMKEHKTFTKYFEMNLTRKFITIVTKRVRRSEIFRSNELYILEQNHVTSTQSVYFDIYLEEIAKILTKMEFLVYTLRELNNYSIEYIEQQHHLTSKTIYNSLHRAKAKIKAHFHNDLDKGMQS